MIVEDYKIYLDLFSKKKFEKSSALENSKIPNTLFKYFALNDNETINESKIKYIEEQKIMLCKLNSFNNPFEGKFLIFD